MTILVTGAAGFIGYHVCRALLDRGEGVTGVDNLNDYYQVGLKHARLEALDHRAFRFHKIDFDELDTLKEAIEIGDVTGIVHLGAQPGVRYSLENPLAYGRSNLMGHLAMLELARACPKLEHMVYASSSSVYGGNNKVPFSEDDRVDHPVSLYAATKRADELMSETYSHLYELPLTGLRFFTVYGPWGRPDMAVWLFTEALFDGKPIRLFANGDLYRDFTYIDDIVTGVVGVLDGPPTGEPRHRLYNIGNNRPEKVTRLIEILEQATGRSAEILHEPLQPGDVERTFADITALQRDYGFSPRTRLEEGLPRFVDWYRRYRGI